MVKCPMCQKYWRCHLHESKVGAKPYESSYVDRIVGARSTEQSV